MAGVYRQKTNQGQLGYRIQESTLRHEADEWLKPNSEKPRGTGLENPDLLPALPAVNGGPITAVAGSPVERGWKTFRVGHAISW